MATGQTTQAHFSHHSLDMDPVSNFKLLVPRLKESLSTLMKVAAQVFHQNAQADGCVKITESHTQKLDKCLEDFYSICDQIELNLKLAIECNNLMSDNIKNTPIPVGPQVNPKNESLPQPAVPGQEPQTYGQYISTVRAQISCAKEVHDALLECARKITERPQIPQPQQQIPMSQ